MCTASMGFLETKRKRQVQFLTLDMELLRNKLASQERITDAAAWRTAEAASPLSCLPS